MDQPILYSQERDFLGTLQTDLNNLSGITTLVYEFVQNADDVKQADGRPGGATTIRFDVRPDRLIIWNDGAFRRCHDLSAPECAWLTTHNHRCDFHRMRIVGGVDKQNEPDTTGTFGIGFNVVYQVTDRPEVFSSGQHWTFRPEYSAGERILGQTFEGEAGTRFELPWATHAASVVRQRLHLPAIQPEQISSFVTEIQDAILPAALFLKQLTRLEVYEAGTLIRRVERQLHGDEVVLVDNERLRRYRIFRTDFSRQAAELRRQYGDLIETKKRSDVLLAFSPDFLDSGRLYATLPSETVVPFPLAINADFYPASDRKRIKLDQDFKSKWNRAAIQAAAAKVATCLENLPELLGAGRLWDFFEAVHAAREHTEYRAFWAELHERLTVAGVVLSSLGEWHTPSRVRYLDSAAEQAAADLLEQLGLPTVHDVLRERRNFLLRVGVPILSVEDVAAALKRAGLDRPRVLDELPIPLQDRTNWHHLWQVLDELLKDRPGRSSTEKVTEALQNCALAFDTTGVLHPPRDLYRGDGQTQALFGQVTWLEAGLPPDKVPGRLVPVFSAKDALAVLEQTPAAHLEQTWQAGSLNIGQLCAWFELHKAEFIHDAGLVNRLRQLPIWPSGGSLRSLVGLYRTGGYRDELGLSSMVDTQVLGQQDQFLEQLGVRELDFATYAREEIPRAMQNRPDMPAELRRRIVNLLARHHSLISDSPGLPGPLVDLPLVECLDGEFYPAQQVYTRQDVIDLLGDSVHIAVPQPSHALQQLYTWLGVASEPRHADLLRRIRALASTSPTPEARQQMETIFAYLADRWPAWEAATQASYSELKTLAWLPVEGRPGSWQSPQAGLFTKAREYLFASQGLFLSFALPVQNRATGAGLTAFLGIKTEPDPQLVVDHLLWSSVRKQPVNEAVYTFLDEKHTHPALDELLGKKCLWLTDHGHYIRPDEAFLGPHPFGRYRYMLRDEMDTHQRLFKRLGIRPAPEWTDYVAVLLQIAKTYREAHPLSDEDYAIVMTCWRVLSEAWTEGHITKAELALLMRQRVIPNAAKHLELPERSFFEDRPGIAEKFAPVLPHRVFPRPQGAWQAMEAVGVRWLVRDMLEIRISQGKVTQQDTFIWERVQERRSLIARLVEQEAALTREHLTMDAVDQLDFLYAPRLSITYQLKLPSKFATPPEEVDALLDGTEVLVCYETGQVPWAALAREIAYAITPWGGGLAAWIRCALEEPTYDRALQLLNQLGALPSTTASVEPPPAAEATGYGTDSEGEQHDPNRQPVADVPPPVAEQRSGTGTAESHPQPQRAEPASGQAGHNEPLGDQAPEPTEPAPNTRAAPQGKAGSDKQQTGPDQRSGRDRSEKRRGGLVWLEPDDATSERDTEGAEHRRTVDQAGIEKVCQHIQRQTGSPPIIRPHHNAGYDLEFRDADGTLNLVEVKSLSGQWDSRNPAQLTPAQHRMAIQPELRPEAGARYWLYIVEFALSDNYVIYTLEEPGQHVFRYSLEHFWQPLATAFYYRAKDGEA